MAQNRLGESSVSTTGETICAARARKRGVVLPKGWEDAKDQSTDPLVGASAKARFGSGTSSVRPE